MAMIKCPECGKDVSSHAKICNNCGFSFEYKIKMRVKLYLLDLYDVFHFHITAYNNKEKIAEACQPFLCDKAYEVPKYDDRYSEYPYVLTMGVIFYGDIDELEFVFEEHLKEKVYKLKVGEYEEANMGLILTASLSPYDVPSIVGGGYVYPGMPQEVLDRLTTYNHPDFDCKFADYDDIEVKCFLTAKYE